MFNKLKFKGALASKGLTMNKLAEKLHMNTTTLYRKTTGTSEFTRDEIQRICQILELQSPVDIFFDKDIT